MIKEEPLFTIDLTTDKPHFDLNFHRVFYIIFMIISIWINCLSLNCFKFMQTL